VAKRRPKRPSKPVSTDRTRVQTSTRARRTRLWKLRKLSPEEQAALPAEDRERLARDAAREFRRNAAWTARAKARFLKHFRESGVVTYSAKRAQVGYRTVYQWLEEDEQFRKLYRDATEEAIDALEAEARRRAVEGTERPVYQGGEKVGSVREYSDTLLVLLLKGKRPAVYRERFEHSGPGGAPLPPAAQFNTVNVYMPDHGRPRRALSGGE
jgi:hypothetical protein